MFALSVFCRFYFEFFVILTVFFFARREGILRRGFGHTRNRKKSISKRVKPQRARRAQRLQRKNSRHEPVNVSPFSLGALCALCGYIFIFQICINRQYLPVVFGSGRRPDWVFRAFRGQTRFCFSAPHFSAHDSSIADGRK